MAGDWNILALRGAYLNEAGLSCLGYIGKSASGMHKIVLVAQTRLNEAPKASKPCPMGLSLMRFDRGWSDNGHYLMDANAPITLTPFSFISFAWAGRNQPRVSPFRAVLFPFLKHRYLVMITRRGISR